MKGSKLEVKRSISVIGVMSLGKFYLHISDKSLLFKMLQSNVLKSPKPSLDEGRDDP